MTAESIQTTGQKRVFLQQRPTTSRPSIFGDRILVIRLTVADLAGLPITFEQVIAESYLDEFGHVNVM